MSTIDDKPTIKEYIEQCGNTARDKGFWLAHEEMLPVQRAVYIKLMLIVSELAEAAEDLRNILGNTDEETRQELQHVSYVADSHMNSKPLGFASEIADATIRIFDLCAYLDIDLDELLEQKIYYNSTRPQLHGRNS